MSNKNRKLSTVYTPSPQPGFLGKGHTARPVIAVDYTQSDPFIMLMDDWLDKKDEVPVGGPHPHAGFETVSLVLKGELGVGPHVMKAGDFEMMTAGSGVVHTETISKPTEMRLLQLWLNLPKKDRKALPRVQRLAVDHVPVMSKDGVDIRVYSGTFAGISSPVKNHTPLVLADIRMGRNSQLIEQLPAHFSTFMYVIDGTVQVGEDAQKLVAGQVGWLDRHNVPEEGYVTLAAGEEGTRLILYAAEPQRHEIVSHGPFIADSMEDIKHLYAEYRAGRIGHISEVAGEQQLVY